MVLNELGEVFAFGKGSHGRLGIGQTSSSNGNNDPTIEDNNTVNQVEPMKIIQGGLKNQKVEHIAAGCRHAACITSKGKLYTWGFNFYE